jgi:ubiquitin C-terminal hydrolase
MVYSHSFFIKNLSLCLFLSCAFLFTNIHAAWYNPLTWWKSNSNAVTQSGKTLTVEPTMQDIIQPEWLNDDEALDFVTENSFKTALEEEKKQQAEYVATCGLENWSGSNCYMNATLQCLAHCPTFLWYINHTNTPNNSVHSDASNLLTTMVHTEDDAINPQYFGGKITTLYFEEDEGNHNEQDAEEFLSQLLDNLSSNHSNNVFRIGLQSKIRCNTCHHIATHDVQENIVSLQIPRLSLFNRVKNTLLWRNISIQDCINSFLAPEALDANNLYHCNACNANTKAQKKLSIHQTPQLLILQLKRFFYDQTTHASNKINTPVRLVTKLTIPCGNAMQQYNLKGVVLHSGNLQGGHYTALVQGKNNQILFCNDSNVSDGTLLWRKLIKTGYSAFGSAYLFFYEQEEAN